MINFSELLWKPEQKPALSRRSRHRQAEVLEPSPNLVQTPVDQVHVALESRLVVYTDSRSPGADRFRYLGIRLGELRDMAKLRSLVITSALPQDGKSTVVLNLATVLAEGGRHSVLVIEGDLHHPTLARRLGVKNQIGLSDCLDGTVDPMIAVRRIEPLHWYLLQAGAIRSNATELLQSGSLAAVLEKLSSQFDWILIDTPPVSPLVDTLTFSRLADASLLVVRADYTPREAVETALSILGPKHVLGVVFNAAEELNQHYAKYNGYYYDK